MGRVRAAIRVTARLWTSYYRHLPRITVCPTAELFDVIEPIVAEPATLDRIKKAWAPVLAQKLIDMVR